MVSITLRPIADTFYINGDKKFDRCSMENEGLRVGYARFSTQVQAEKKLNAVSGIS